MIQTVYLVDTGVRPWTSLEESDVGAYQTLTIVARSRLTMLALLFQVFAILSQLFPKIYRWYTIITPFSRNKIQLRKLKIELGEDVPGFRNTYLRESTMSGVWCNTSELEIPFGSNQLDHLSDGQKTVLMFSSNNIENSEEAWTILSVFTDGFGLDSVVGFLERNPDLVLGRMYEEESHVAFQMYGAAKDITDIKSRLMPIGMVLMDERDDVVDFINAA